MISLSTVPSIASVVADLESARRAVGDFTEPLQASVESVIGPSIDANFASGGRPAWRPLADITLEYKANARILEETGRLREIATSSLPWSIRDDSAVLVARQLGQASYGIFHELGTRVMPARPWGLFQEQDVNDIEEIFAQHGITSILDRVSVMSAL